MLVIGITGGVGAGKSLCLQTLKEHCNCKIVLADDVGNLMRYENGKKTQALKSFTISGNFFELLKNITALSDEIEFGLPGVFTSYASAAALVENMSVAGE